MGAAPPNVVIVEDSIDDMLLTRRAMRKAGIGVPVHVCVDGEAGIRHLRGEPPPALVLLDWKLPRRSGAEVLAWMRAQPALGAVPVIVVSSSRLPEDIDAARAAGANAFLEKPLQFQALLEQLDRLGLKALRTEGGA
jgi:CheY-like chemotaxis protein